MVTRVKTENGFRFLGLSEEAKRLGVTPSHLSYVLSGKRESARILREVRVRDVVEQVGV